jgi:hypothetical protein
MRPIDRMGAGPERFKLKGRVVYPIKPLLMWLEKRVQPAEEDD